MRLLLASSGSEGDIRPFYALGRKLVAAGHDVTLAAADRWEARATELGIPFVAVERWKDDEVRAIFERVLRERNPMKQLAIVLDGIADDQRLAVPRLKELAKDTDVVVYPPLFVAAAAAARAVGTRHVSVQLAPVHTAAGYGPTGADWGALLNRFSWSIAKALLRRATDARLNTIVRAAGLDEWRDIMLESASSTLLDLVAVSPHFMPKDPAWGEHVVVTGYWFLDEPAATPDPRLEAFVAEGEAPVVVGFGSMMGFDAKKTMEIIFEAARGLERRVVVQSGWAELRANDVPKNVHVAPFVPHAWLFSRAACVVHHGGAGTTAAALRAGVPQTIVWYLGDQPAWGTRVAQRGVGLPMRSHHDLDARWLRATIERMTADGELKARARVMGEAIAKEDGLGRAVSALGGVA
jgi:sterol 3beta-glucosyltransferase